MVEQVESEEVDAALTLPAADLLAQRGDRSRRVAVRAIAVTVLLVGVMNIVSAVIPTLPYRVVRLAHYLPLQVSYGHLAAALGGVGLLFIARGLAWRKRAAWVLALALLGVSIAGHLAKGDSVFEASVALLIAAALVWQRRAYYARPDTPSLLQGVRVASAAFIVTLAYGATGFFLLDRHFSVNFGLRAAIVQTFEMFVRFSDPGLQPITGFGRYFADSIYSVAAVTFGFALFMLLRPVLVRRPASAAERVRAEGIVTEWGDDLLARLALLPDKAYRFSPGGSVIAFTVSGGVALALGGPIGPPSDRAEAVSGFVAAAARRGWRPAFYQVRPDALETYRALGMDALRVGHDAVIDPRAFTLAGKRYGSLRSRNRQLEREGYTVTVEEPPHHARLVRELRLVSDEWLASAQGTEKRFSLGWFDEGYVRSVAVAVLRDPDRVPVAFVSLSPEYRTDGVAIDLMRSQHSAPSGAMDLIFVRVIEWAAGHGLTRLDLGLSALAGVGEDPADPAAEKALRLVYEWGNGVYGFRGLHEYKAKFRPAWEPRSLVYPDLAALPAVLAALVRVHTR